MMMVIRNLSLSDLKQQFYIYALNDNCKEINSISKGLMNTKVLNIILNRIVSSQNKNKQKLRKFKFVEIDGLCQWCCI